MFKKNFACLHKPTPVFNIQDVDYFACGMFGAKEFKDGLLINLSNTPHYFTNKLPEQLKQHVVFQFDEVVIPCPDFSIPQVSMDFWLALNQYISDKKYTRVCIHCEEGHGRTGTFLSAILITMCNFGAEQAIELVRNSYCKCAVETSEQIEYLNVLSEHFEQGL